GLEADAGDQRGDQEAVGQRDDLQAAEEVVQPRLLEAAEPEVAKAKRARAPQGPPGLLQPVQRTAVAARRLVGIHGEPEDDVPGGGARARLRARDRDRARPARPRARTAPRPGG